MNDNVFNFPKKELNIEVELEDDGKHAEIVSAVEQMMFVHANGIFETIDDVTWEHIFDASFGMLISAAFKAEIHPQDLEEMLHSVSVEEHKFDA